MFLTASLTLAEGGNTTSLFCMAVSSYIIDLVSYQGNTPKRI